MCNDIYNAAARIIIQLSNGLQRNAATKNRFLQIHTINSIMATLFECHFDQMGRKENFLKKNIYIVFLLHIHCVGHIRMCLLYLLQKKNAFGRYFKRPTAWRFTCVRNTFEIEFKICERRWQSAMHSACNVNGISSPQSRENTNKIIRKKYLFPAQRMPHIHTHTHP